MVCPVEPVCRMGQRDSGAAGGWRMQMEAEVKLTMMMSRRGGDSVWLGNWWGAGRRCCSWGAPAFQRKLTHSRCPPRPSRPSALDEVISDQWRTTTLNGSWWLGPGTSARWLRIVQRQTDQWDLEGQARPLQTSVPEQIPGSHYSVSEWSLA